MAKLVMDPKAEVVSLEEMTARWQRTEEERVRLQEKFDSLYEDYKRMRELAGLLSTAIRKVTGAPDELHDRDLPVLLHERFPQGLFPDTVRVIFDGPPSHQSGRFVELENSRGVSLGLGAGSWHERGDGLWELRLQQVPVTGGTSTADLAKLPIEYAMAVYRYISRLLGH